MSAGNKAIPLIKENPEWKDKLPSFTCESCGYQGNGHELLCEEDETTLYCPVCRTAAWVWN